MHARSNLKKFARVASAAALMSLVTPAARAELIWSWSFNTGGETGTFRTNGTAADLTTNSNFVIDPTTFTVTSSTSQPSAVGLSYDAGSQPTVGFLWDGTLATQFYRASGTYTNGATLYSTNGGANYFYAFYSDGTNISANAGIVYGAVTGYVPASLSGQVFTAPVPVPASSYLLIASLLGLAAASRLRVSSPSLS
jgi:hypothetical protein